MCDLGRPVRRSSQHRVGLIRMPPALVRGSDGGSEPRWVGTTSQHPRNRRDAPVAPPLSPMAITRRQAAPVPGGGGRVFKRDPEGRDGSTVS
jgi:hypothetical protein